MNTVKTKKPVENFEAEGLCATCIHKENCIYCNALQVVHQCEEFDAFTETRKINKIATPVKKNTEEEIAGLCANCANRDNCMFAKPRGGVWHCEEYR